MTQNSTREEQAAEEIGNTTVSRRGALVFSLVFLLLLWGVFAEHLLRDRSAFASLGKFPLHEWEEELNNTSLLRKKALHTVQHLLLKYGGTGSEKAIPGKDGYLFYPEDLHYLAEEGFMRKNRQKKARIAGREPDPVMAAADLKEQLSRRGIRLIVVPVPVKTGFYGDKLGAGAKYLQNKNLWLYLGGLREKRVEYVDLAEDFQHLREAGTEVFLKTDTHWTPEAMDLAAKRIAAKMGVTTDPPFRPAVPVTNTGDTARLIGEDFYPPETVRLTVRDVIPSSASDVLILGDSFVNIYSLGTMNWGIRAGLAEQIAARIGRPVDMLSRNDGGDFASREMLARELSRGRDRLSGKKTVIWVFSARKLPGGNWKKIPLRFVPKKEPEFFVPTKPVEVTGMVIAVSKVPRPGTTTYKDHIMSIHVGDIGPEGKSALVYMESMRDNRWLPAAYLRSGEKVKLLLSPWSAGDDNPRNGWNRSEIEDETLLLQEPCYGKLIP